MTSKNSDMTPHTTEPVTEGAEHPNMERRKFLSTTAAVGGAMVVGFWMPGSTRCAEAQTETQTLPPLKGSHVPAQLWYRDALVPEMNAWIIIAPDDTVTMRINQTEIGTGVLTSNSMIVAEE